jgi:hypothetical protein
MSKFPCKSLLFLREIAPSRAHILPPSQFQSLHRPSPSFGPLDSWITATQPQFPQRNFRLLLRPMNSRHQSPLLNTIELLGSIVTSAMVHLSLLKSHIPGQILLLREWQFLRSKTHHSHVQVIATIFARSHGIFHLRRIILTSLSAL